MTTPSLETRQLYNQIRSDLITLHYRLKLFHQVYDTEETIDLLGRFAPTLFFRVIYPDLLDEFSIGISRLLDAGITKFGARASLYTFVSEIRKFDKDMAEEMEKDIDEARKKSHRIIDWRNKWAGHRDHKVTLRLQARLIGKAQSPIGFNLTEVNESLNGIGQILNKFEAKYTDVGNFPDNPTVEQIEERQYKISEPVDYSTLVETNEGSRLIELLKRSMSI